MTDTYQMTYKLSKQGQLCNLWFVIRVHQLCLCMQDYKSPQWWFLPPWLTERHRQLMTGYTITSTSWV